MEVVTQYVQAQKEKGKATVGETLQIVLVPNNATEKALLGAAYMLGCPRDVTLEEGGSLAINFEVRD